MKSNQGKAIWPYLAILASLFMLSVMAPRGWEQGAPVRTATPLEPGSSAASMQASPAIVRPSPALVQAPELTPAALPDDLADIDSPPQRAEPAEKVTSEHFVDSSAELAMRKPIFRHAPEPAPTVAAPESPAPITPVAVAPARPSLAPQALVDALTALQEHAECQAWSRQVLEHVEAVTSSPLVSTDSTATAAQHLAALDRLADEATKLAAHIKDIHVSTQLSRAQYALRRRLDVWQFAYVTRSLAVGNPAENASRLNVRIAAVEQVMRTDPAGPAWKQYLMLDALRSTAGDSGVQGARSQTVAQNVLKRMASERLTAAQRKFLRSAAIVALRDELQQVVTGEIEAETMIAEMEKYEQSGLSTDARRLGVLHSILAASPDKRRQELADKLEGSYRNANVRLTVTGTLLNRLAPKPEPVEGDVDDMIVGIPIQGHSVTTTRLFVRLVPDKTKLRIGLEANGVVNSRTQATSGPATFVNQGQAQFQVRKLVLLSTGGMRLWPAVADADANTDLEALYTSFDRVPLFGSLVRNYAMNRRDEMQDQSSRETEEKVASKACSRVDEEIGPRLEKAEQTFRQKYVAPLDDLSLEPLPISLETTAEQLVMRFRLAGHDQLGAHTPRPLSPADSLLSMQIHESAVNNFLENLDLSGRTFDLPGLHHWIAEKMGRPDATPPDDLPTNVSLQFADDAVRVRFEQGRVTLHLAIAELKQGKSHWKDFQVEAHYVPEMNGPKINLVRDGVIELTGEQIKGRPVVGLRGIFSKVLSAQRQLPVVPKAIAEDPRLADLKATQCLFEDGWMAWALCPPRADKVVKGIKLPAPVSAEASNAATTNMPAPIRSVQKLPVIQAH